MTTTQRNSASKRAGKQPETILEFETIAKKDFGLVYPFERDDKGYLFDGKRVSHSRALRLLAQKMNRRNGGWATLDGGAFQTFLNECAALVAKGEKRN